MKLKILEINFACDKCDNEKMLGFLTEDVKKAVLDFECFLDDKE